MGTAAGRIDSEEDSVRSGAAVGCLGMRTNPSCLISAVALVAASSLIPSQAAADEGFAEPPGRSRVAVASSGPEEPAVTEASNRDTPSSTVRLFVGPAGRFASSGASPGLLTAIELGRGPAGFRIAGAWVDVGSDRGISEYTGELTVDFGGRSRIRPNVGAGGGVARTSASRREDGTLDGSSGATLGVGVVRGGLGVRLPFEETDARVALDVSGSFPVVRSEGARDVQPWALAALTVGVGF